MLLFLFHMGVFTAFSQDGTQRAHLNDTVFHKVDSLKAAIVTATLRPRIKGDTIEYNTSNIRLRAFANVEELLGRLPGLQIDANGSIMLNGEKIQHLLVDGEDIFGNNPTLVTRNFDASKIDRVQLLDRKSDQAVFTGVDDGTRTKTLNLVLKQSAKDGYFGKVEAGGNTNGFYNANVALAGFSKKEQFTALGIAANTGVVGFTNNVGGASASLTVQAGTMDPLGALAGVGIPQFAGTALHYANTWNGTVDHVTGNYQYSYFSTHPISTTQTIQTLSGSVYNQSQQSQSFNQQDQHWGVGVYDWQPSANSAVKLVLHGSTSVRNNQFSASGASRINDTLVNNNQRTIRDGINQNNMGADLSWRTQIKKTGRIFSLQFSASNTGNKTNGYLYSIDRLFLSNGNVQSVDTVDQRKQISDNATAISGSTTYTEPLWNGTILAFSYGISRVVDRPLDATFNRGDGKYIELIDSLSNHQQTTTISQRCIINLQGSAHHLTYNLGSDFIGYSYRQRDLLTDSVLQLHSLVLAPRIIATYNFNPETKIQFLYNEMEQKPSAAQLQPVKNNNDPLHITLGNPDLRPAFNQSFHLDFHRFKTWMINVGLSLSLASNSISTKTITDSLGRQISQPVNVDGGHTAALNFSVNRKIMGIDLGLHATGNYSLTVNYIDVDLSRNNAYTGGGGFSLNKYEADKYKLQLNTDFVYFNQVSSVNTAAPVHYWTQTHTGTFTLYLIRNYEINTNASYTWQQKTNTFATNNSVLLWNSYISRSFLQNRLVIKAQLNNILNQNAGINRTNVNNVNTETSTNILGRYWMLSMIYHFDRKFQKK